MRTPSWGRGLEFLLLASAVAAALLPVPAPLGAALLAGALFLFPGAGFLALCGHPRSATRDLLLGPALSPLLLGLLAVLADHLGWDQAAAARALAAASGILIVLLPDRVDPESRAEPGAASWWTGALLALPVIGVLGTSPWRRITSDAWFHAAVVFEIERAGLPPEDPYFAGLPLQYFWFFHAALVALGRGSGIGPADMMAVLNVLAAALCVPAAARVARALGFARNAGVWAGVVLLLGMGGLFWLFFPVKLLAAATGELRGAEALRYIFQFEWTPERTSGFTQILISSGFFLRKFLVGTAASWGILLVLVAAGAGLRVVRGAPRRESLVFLAAVLGAILFHIVLGVACLAAFAAGCGLAALVRRGPVRAWIVPALALLAALACVPYLRGVAGTKESDNLFPLGIHWLALASLPFTLAGVAGLSVPALRRLAAARTPEAATFLGWLAISMLYALFARLPGPNQFDKPPIVPYLPLALAAGASIPLLWSAWAKKPGRRRLFALFLVLFLVPENAIQWGGFFGSRAAPAMSADEAALYRWIGEETPRDAIFIDSLDRTDVLVRGPRRQYWGIEAYAFQWGYPRAEMDRRRAIRDALIDGAPDETQVAALRALGAPVYVIVRNAESPAGRSRLAADPRFTEAWSSPEAAVFRLR